MELNLTKALLAAGLVVILLVADGGEAAAPNSDTFTYERNGVRLVGGDATYGRLELFPRPRSSDSSEWVTVCDEKFKDRDAEMMCILLGYQYGRKYYDPRLVYLVNKSQITQVDITSCEYPPTIGYYDTYRGLQAILPTENPAGRKGGELNSDEHSPNELQRQRRSMFINLNYLLNVSDSAPYTCDLEYNPCNKVDEIPFVGAIQCSNTSFPPAPSPPPSPPPPPPSPPSPSNSIRYIGRAPNPFQPDGPLHPNLCATESAAKVCTSFARVELLVDSPNKRAPGKIWAPLCNITNTYLARYVAGVACEQRYQTYRDPWRMPIWKIEGIDVSTTPFYMPKAANYSQLREGDFNPKNIGGFVTITGYGNASKTKLLQAFEFKVSLNPCSRGAMLAVNCRLSQNSFQF